MNRPEQETRKFRAPVCLSVKWVRKPDTSPSAAGALIFSLWLQHQADFLSRSRHMICVSWLEQTRHKEEMDWRSVYPGTEFMLAKWWLSVSKLGLSSELFWEAYDFPQEMELSHLRMQQKGMSCLFNSLPLRTHSPTCLQYKFYLA